MREQLVGYLLGALEDTEREQVEAELKQNLQLQRELELLHESLAPLHAANKEFSPPPHLVQQTCRLVASLQADQQAPHAARPAASAPARPPFAPPGATAIEPTQRWTALDVTAMFGVLFVTALVLFPALHHSRVNARLLACQENLRQLGVALIRYSQADKGRYFPSLATHGNMAAAGVYAVKLFDAGYISPPNLVLCPSSSLAELADTFKVPTQRELAEAQGEQLVQLHRQMGGSYGYNLGYLAGGNYCNVRNESRSNYALMSDAPSPLAESRRSDNHGRCGQNVLYEDGHVAHRTSCFQQQHDHLFLNDDGLVAAGNHRYDVVLGQSASRPLPLVSALHTLEK